MKSKYIIVAIVGILFISSIVVFLGYGQNKPTPQNSIEIIKETQKSIQNSVAPTVQTPTSSNNTTNQDPTPITSNNYNFSDVAITNLTTSNLSFLDGFETYTLLDQTKLVILTKVQFDENLQKIADVFNKSYPQDKEIPPLTCRSKSCNLLVTKDNKIILPQGNISYLTSFKKDNEIFWFYYVNELDGLITAFYSKPLFRDVKPFIFPSQVGGLKEKGENSGIFDATLIQEDEQERITGTKLDRIDLLNILKEKPNI
jgi:hypothetical protein